MAIYEDESISPIDNVVQICVSELKVSSRAAFIAQVAAGSKLTRG